MLNVAVALMLFNRPEATRRAFAQIAKVRPSKLFLVADGPRKDYPADQELCQEARAVVQHVDWDCEVNQNFSDFNRGCGLGPATGISWVFQHVDEAIILEDDCLPHPSFFEFCKSLLERYRDDDRVMNIGGQTFEFPQKRTPHSYFFSKYVLCSGSWATWRRAWRQFDFRMADWPTLREGSFLGDVLDHGEAVEHWRSTFDAAFAGLSDDTAQYWDYQWNLTCWQANGLSIWPNQTLATNIGFGPDATNTKKASDPRANIPATQMVFPLSHPPHVERDVRADKALFRRMTHRGKRPPVYRRAALRAARQVRGSVRGFTSLLPSRAERR